MKINNVMKKVFAAAMSVVLGFGTAIVTANAETLGDGGFTGYWGFTTGQNFASKDQFGSVSSIRYLSINGHPAYCVQPEVVASTTAGAYRLDGVYNMSFDDLQKQPAGTRKVLEIAYFGDGYGGRGGEIWRAATQVAVWRTIGVPGLRVYQYGNPSYLNRTAATEVTGTVNAYADAIIADVNNYEAGKLTPAARAGASPAFYAGNGTQRVVTLGDLPAPNKKISIKIVKGSADTTITDGNPCYSLSGAVFRIYDNFGTTLGDITADASGVASGSWTVKASVTGVQYQEITAPHGYDNSSKNVKSAALDSTVTVLDSPLNDPMTITLQKQPFEGMTDKPASLNGAQYTVKYYAIDSASTKEDVAAATPTRTWVIETKYQDAAKKYIASLDEEHFVSGDALYYDVNGVPTLPLGIFTVQETKVPDVVDANKNPIYTLNNVTVNSTSGEILDENNGIVMFRITETNGGAYVAEGNDYTVKEIQNRGSLTVQKHDSGFATLSGIAQSAKPQGDAANLTTTYTITNLNDYDATAMNNKVALGTMAANGGTYSFTTDANGSFVSPADFLPVGKYRVTETVSPAGYLISSKDNKTLSITKDIVITANTNTDLTQSFGDDISKGGFSVQKYDTETGVRSQGNTNLTTTYELYNKSLNPIIYKGKGVAVNGLVDTYTTDANGYYESANNLLPYGTYSLKETIAPNGYSLGKELDPAGAVTASQTAQFSIREDGQMCRAQFENDDVKGKIVGPNVTNVITDHVIAGSFSIHKTISGSSTESSFSKPEEGATFLAVLKKYAQEQAGEGNTISRQNVIDAYNNAATWTGKDNEGKDVTGYTAREYCKIVTDVNGNATSPALAYGEYVIVQLSAKSDESVVIQDVLDDFEVKTENQATVQYNANNIPQPYSLRLEKYDKQTGKLITLNSADFRIYQLTDASGNAVNKYVEQKVGSQKYSIFRTASENDSNVKDLPAGTFYSQAEGEGKTATPLTLEIGKYRIEEVPNGLFNGNKTPANFATMDPITVEVNANSIFRADDDEDGERVVRVKAYNTQITTELSINKSIAEYVADKSFVDRNDLSAIGFNITAAEDIYNADDGTILMHAGDAARDIYGNVVASFHVDKDGNATISNLPLGKYVLSETEEPNGLVLNTNTYTIESRQKKKSLLGMGEYLDSNTADYDKDVNGNPAILQNKKIVNDTTKVAISKKAVTGIDEIDGAKLTVTDANGTAVDTWTSGDKPHTIEGLTVGETYTLSETVPADGYVKAADIEFTIDNDGEVHGVKMIDKYVSISKVDMNGTEIKDAVMSVLDENGNVVEKWTSDGTEHRVNGLEENKNYTLHEDTTPAGYVTATDVKFIVTGADTDGNKEDQNISMTDISYSVDKTDMGGTEVEGAKMSVTDKAGNVIDQWTSSNEAHKVSGLIAGHSYILHEDTSPAGYVKATDIEFTVEDNGTDQSVSMTDKIVSINKTDGNGNEVPGANITVIDKDGKEVDKWVSTDKPHNVSNLVVGNTYTWHEDYSEDIFGHYYAEDYTFTVTDDGIDQALEMKDAPINYEIAKVDDNGNYVKGVTLKLMDTTDNKEVALPNQGITTDKPFELYEELKAEHSYALTEEEYVAGYYKVAEAVNFTVSKFGTSSVTTITMMDATTNISARKVDDDGKPVAGAEMGIYEAKLNEDGKTYTKGDIVYDFVTTDKPEDISSYVKGGETYILSEVKTPFGYRTAEDVTFKITGTKDSPQTIVAIDHNKHFYASVVKVDINDETQKLAGAEFTVFNKKDDSVAKLADGSDAKIVTDGEGSAVFELTFNPDGYYIMETGAPEGYLLNKDKFDVTLSEDYDFAKENPIIIKVADTLAPKENHKTGSGVGETTVAFGFAGMIALVCGTLYMVMKKKEESSDEGKSE